MPPLDRPTRNFPTECNPTDVKDQLLEKISAPLAEGNMRRCVQLIHQFFQELHDHRMRDIGQDEVEIWWCHGHSGITAQLEELGLDDMRQFVKHPPSWYGENVKFVGETHVRMIAEAQRRYREALEEQKLRNALAPADPFSMETGIDTSQAV